MSSMIEDAIENENIEKYLLAGSAAISGVKGLLSVGTYSYLNVLFAIIELALTGCALYLFMVNDDYDDQLDENYLTFVIFYFISLLVEVLDVFSTFRTVYKFRGIRQKYGAEVASELKKSLGCTYMSSLFLALCIQGVTVVFTFKKTDWDVEKVSPQDFSGIIDEKVSRLAYVAALLMVFSLFLNVCCGSRMQKMNALYEVGRTEDALRAKCAVFFMICSYLILPLYVYYMYLLYSAVRKVSDENEAGSLTYLLLIFALQYVEFAAEERRLSEIYKFEVKAEMEIEADEQQQQGDDCEKQRDTESEE